MARAGDVDHEHRRLQSGVDRDPRDAVARLALAEHWQRRGFPSAARAALEGLPEDVARAPAYISAAAGMESALGPA